MQTAVMLVAVGILSIIGYRDIRTRHISNVLTGAIAILSVITGGFLLFWCGVLGGGDAKLMAAMALLIGYHDLFGFLFLMSLCGGALGLAILARDKLRPRLWRPALSASTPLPAEATPALARSTVPYGAAIAAAGIIILILETPLLK